MSLLIVLLHPSGVCHSIWDAVHPGWQNVFLRWLSCSSSCV